MKVAFEDGFQRKLLRLRRRNYFLYQKVRRAVKLFQVDQQYPALKLHKLKGNLDIYWSLSVEKNFRLVFYYESKGAVFCDMGTHDEVYRK